MLVSHTELALRLTGSSWVIFDCRHDLTDHARGARLYAEGHIPGAHFVAVESVLAGAKTGRNGRHPLPAPAAFGGFLSRHGVTPASHLIAYDDAGGLYAARFWWLARWIGLQHVHLLDGGLTKWLAEGRQLTTHVPTVTPAAVPLPGVGNPAAVLSVDEVLARLDDPACALIDARIGERYRGETEPVDPVAGHIPGAFNRPYRANLNADATFRPAAELRHEFQTLLNGRAPEKIGHSCGSGITACANLFAMDYAGLAGSKLYAGSWSEWIADPTRPVARAGSRTR